MVSVIIPNFNHASFLRQRIDSVLNQSFRDFEIIILDDASTDTSRDIIEEYRDSERVATIVYNQQNSGSTFLQWEKGIALCKYDYVWIAESDDWCEASFLATLIKPLQENSGLVVSYCQSYAIGNNDKINWTSESPYLESIVKGNVFINEKMLFNTAIFNASMAVWRRSAFTAVTREYTSFRYCGDWLFWIELCRQGDVFVSGRLLNYFRMHDGDVSTKMQSTGGDLVEQGRMFRILHSRGWITDDVFSKVVTQLYIQLQESAYTDQKTKEISVALFPDVKAKTLARRNYLLYKIKVDIKKIVRRLFD